MNRKNRKGIVYSTDPDFKYNDESGEKASIPAGKQMLYIWLDSKSRKGKTVTLIRGFEGPDEDLQALAREIKAGCGTGGSVKQGEIIIQGDFREKVMNILTEKGYKAKKAGGK